MKHLLAKSLIWLLGRLGYEKNYSNKNEIKIRVDSKKAEKALQRLTIKAENLQNTLEEVNRIAKPLKLKQD